MSPNDALTDLLLELDRTHTAAYIKSDAFRTERELPSFATAANGEVRNFYKPSRKLLAILTIALYEQHATFNKRIDEKRFAEFVRQAVVDLHASDALVDSPSPLKDLVDDLRVRVDAASPRFTHSFPAWTCGVEARGPWQLGPVTFMTWPQWLEQVDFSDHAKATAFREPAANLRWKALLLEAIADPKAPAPTGLAKLFCDAVSGCPSVLRVEVDGLDKNLSSKLAEIVCKGALDAVSLLIGQRQAFVQQALEVERLPPTRLTNIIESEGFLWMPGSSLTDRVPSLQNERTHEFLMRFSAELGAMGHVLRGLLDRGHPHRQLASRWTTALDWYAEGQRERGDAIALAKFGTALDVLASGGKFPGILGLLTHLFDIPEDAAVSRGTKTSTLKSLVKDIYDSGRSQILHGNRHDRMEAFEHDRAAAAYLARLALIEAALRLETYTGVDEPKAFRTMPARAT